MFNAHCARKYVRHASRMLSFQQIFFLPCCHKVVGLIMMPGCVCSVPIFPVARQVHTNSCSCMLHSFRSLVLCIVILVRCGDWLASMFSNCNVSAYYLELWQCVFLHVCSMTLVTQPNLLHFAATLWNICWPGTIFIASCNVFELIQYNSLVFAQMRHV